MSNDQHPIDELHSVVDFIRWGASRFVEAELYYGHGTNNAIDDSMALVLHALHLPFGMSSELFSSRLTRAEKQTVLELFEQRISRRIPVPYLTHEAVFAGLSFFVDERVLVPRSPIAELIEQGFAPWLDADQIEHVLDLCTGSGCIAIACAMALPYAQVDASDISTDALAVTDINIQRHQLDGRVQAHQADLFKGLPTQRYDLIVSNPPYVDAEDMASLPDEFHHEPELGLASGQDGLDACMQILNEAANWLTDDGVLIVEVGNSAHALAMRLPEVPFLWLEFERGGDGVFLLTASQINECKNMFTAALAKTA